MIESTATPAIDAYAARCDPHNLRRVSSVARQALDHRLLRRQDSTLLLHIGAEAIRDVAPDERPPSLHRQQQHARVPVFQGFVDRLLDKL